MDILYIERESWVASSRLSRYAPLRASFGESIVRRPDEWLRRRLGTAGRTQKESLKGKLRGRNYSTSSSQASELAPNLMFRYQKKSATRNSFQIPVHT